MSTTFLDELLETECEVKEYELEDYESNTPRWCKGCGDHGILSSVQRLLRDRQIAPENVVRVKNGIDLRRFPLRGGHEKVACATCHIPRAEDEGKMVRFKPLPTDCRSCHGNDGKGQP